MQKRVNAKACQLFEDLLGIAISDKAGLKGCSSKRGFRRVVVQDSTCIALPRHLKSVFKGSGNASSQCAGAKVHASYDLLGKRFLALETRQQSEPDQAFALEGAQGLGEGDLLLRDLGYFSTKAFHALDQRKVKVLTRWQPKVALVDPESLDTLDIFSLLGSCDKVDRQVLVTRKQRVPMRLIAFKVPARIAEKRRRKAKETGKRKGRNPSSYQLALLDWQIYLTNCSSERLAFEDAFELYRQRWGIEILFKGFKSHMGLDRISAYANEHMARCLILCTLIRIVLCSGIVAEPMVGKERRISMLKLFSLVEALGFVPDGSYFEKDCQRENFLRHCQHEKRSKKTLCQRLEGLG